jgi:hypothetical protein
MPLKALKRIVELRNFCWANTSGQELDDEWCIQSHITSSQNTYHEEKNYAKLAFLKLLSQYHQPWNKSTLHPPNGFSLEYWITSVRFPDNSHFNLVMRKISDNSKLEKILFGYFLLICLNAYSHKCTYSSCGSSEFFSLRTGAIH